MTFSQIIVVPAFAIICSATFAQEQPQPASAPAPEPAVSAPDNASAPAVSKGFLSNYTRLSPGLSAKNDFQSYTAPGATGRKLGRVYILPVIAFPEDSEFTYLDRATVTAFLSELYSDVSSALHDKIILVTSADQADTIIQIAMTGVTAMEPDRKPRDYLPFRLVTKPIKDAAMGKQQEVIVTLEMKIRNAKTNKTIYESLGRAKGSTMGRSDDTNLHADIKDLEPVIASWTKQVSKSVTTLQNGN